MMMLSFPGLQKHRYKRSMHSSLPLPKKILSISTAFIAHVTGGILEAASDASKVMRISDYTKMDLAFDHKQILSDYKKLKDKLAVK